VSQGRSRKYYLPQRAVLCFDALELVEDQIAERVEDDAGLVALPRLDHVRMMTGHNASARIDGGVSELDLLSVGARRVFDAGMH
jgi:hypothetical protein